VIERLKLLLGISWSRAASVDSFLHLGDGVLEGVPESTVFIRSRAGKYLPAIRSAKSGFKIVGMDA
jgi:hypothetical protein